METVTNLLDDSGVGVVLNREAELSIAAVDNHWHSQPALQVDFNFVHYFLPVDDFPLVYH